jgi:hypothetical protein
MMGIKWLITLNLSRQDTLTGGLAEVDGSPDRAGAGTHDEGFPLTSPDFSIFTGGPEGVAK